MNSSAQEFENISNVAFDTKLENYNFTSITQDANGFIWLGTNLGLFRYDGYHFIKFNTNTNPTILENSIKSLLIDGENLWIGSKGGLSILNTTTNEVVNILNQKDDDKSITNNDVTKIFKDKCNTIWVGYNTNKISKYLGNHQFQTFNFSKLNTDDKVHEIFEAQDSTLIIQFINKKLLTSKIMNARLNGTSLKTKLISEAIIDGEVLFKKDSIVCLIKKNDIYNYNHLSKQFILNKKIVINIENTHGSSYVDEFNNVFTGSKKKTLYYLTTEEKLLEIEINSDSHKRWINTFFIDHSGLLWVGTTSGLYTLKKKKKLFKKHLHSKGLTEKNKIGSLLQDYLGNIYAVNQKDLFKYDSITGKFNNLNWVHPKKNLPLELIEYDSTNFLIGLQGGGIGIYNKTTNIIKDFFEGKKIASIKRSVLKLYKDKQNIVWIGTYTGLKYYDKKNDTLVKMLDLKLFGENLNHDIIFDIKLYKDSMLLVGTSNGLYLLKVYYSTFPLKIEASKISNIPYEIHNILIKNNIVWLGTLFNGLVRYNIETKKVTTFKESMWLTNKTVYSLVSGAKNELWIGTINGLSSFNTITKQFLNFYDYDGLAGNQFNLSSQLKTKKGNLFLGGRNGITSFSPSEIKIDATNLNLNPISISWYNHSKNATYSNNKINNKNLSKITIPYNHAFIKFEFALSNFFMPKTTSFKYKLNGLHSDWRTLKENNELSFTNLPPGNYVLEVMASLTNGVWNKKMITLPILVNQIYYKKWWFIVGLLGLFLLFLFFTRKHELNHIEKMEQLRLRISRDLHDELGSSLTGIAIKSDILLEKINFKIKKQILTEISEQSRNAVDSLSDIVWALDSKNNNIQKLSDRMESTLFQFLSPLQITYTFKSFKTNKLLELNQDYRQHVFLIFKEAITNIMKHSNATHIFVSFTKEKNTFKLIVKDNGTKIPKSEVCLNGNGIQNMKTRAKKIKGEIHFSFENGCSIELFFKYLN